MNDKKGNEDDKKENKNVLDDYYKPIHFIYEQSVYDLMVVVLLSLQ